MSRYTRKRMEESDQAQAEKDLKDYADIDLARAWTKEWQEKERQADEDIASGNFRDFENLDALLKDLHSEH